ncbi:MAG: hypothetical protein WDN01_02140 [Rhizomicrobium sp.]
MKTLLPLALTICLLPAAAMADPNFQVPDMCKSTGVTGSEEAEAGEPPVVTITYNSGKQEVTSVVTLTVNTDKIWFASVALPAYRDDYLVTTTYTPFLQSYMQVSSSTRQPFALPPPGWNYQKKFATVQIQIQDGSGKLIPNAYIELAPDYDGSSPYTMQADQNAMVTINCLTVPFVGGTPATVLDPNHNILYATQITFNSNGEGIAKPAD